jgi:O-antigen biosynthesis protein
MRWFRRTPLRWCIVTSAPKGEAGLQWGDTWFAEDLADALRRAGQDVRVTSRAGATAAGRDRDDVVMVLRGLRDVVPRRANPEQQWLLWVISHPELVTPEECAQYDAVFVASEHWRPVPGVVTLLQATNPHRFVAPTTHMTSGEPVLFVGSTRGEFRPMVRDAIAAGIDVGVYGVGWEAFIDPSHIRGAFLPNDELPRAYATAGVVLNDHWPLMAEHGFLSNRLFDAVAAGAHVISDPALGLTDVFGDAVTVVRTPEELHTAISQPVKRDRRADSEYVAREHSFDARVRVLITEVERRRT